MLDVHFSATIWDKSASEGGRREHLVWVEQRTRPFPRLLYCIPSLSLPYTHLGTPPGYKDYSMMWKWSRECNALKILKEYQRRAPRPEWNGASNPAAMLDRGAGRRWGRPPPPTLNGDQCGAFFEIFNILIVSDGQNWSLALVGVASGSGGVTSQSEVPVPKLTLTTNLCSWIFIYVCFITWHYKQRLQMYANTQSYRVRPLSWVRRTGHLHSSNLSVDKFSKSK